MARPLKEGLDYFPHDTDANSDDKMQALKALHGMAGCGVYWELVEKIYRSSEGYLLLDVPWKRNVLASSMRMELILFDSMLASMLDVGLFLKSTYEQEHKLTSDGLVKRREYLLAHRMEMRERRAKGQPEKKPLSQESIDKMTVRNAVRNPTLAHKAENINGHTVVEKSGKIHFPSEVVDD